MITTPSKSDSNKFLNTSNNNNNILEISDNKVQVDFPVPSISIYNQKIGDEENNHSNYLSKIHTSIISDDLEQLEKLLKLGENPDEVNKSGETPLYLSVDIENYDAMIILLEFGADCNIQKNDGNTALHLATEKKLDIYICSLLSHGANPNIINKTNLQTPLHIGIINKINEYVLKKYKENNGDIYNIKDKYNKTPFDYAKNDEKYKNLLISIFSEQNNNNDNIKNKNINENSIENYHNFISLSRKIHIADEDNKNNNGQNNDNNKGSEKSNNNIRDINNCLKKHLIFSSNSKETSSEEKKKKLSSNNSSSAIELNDKNSQGDMNKNIINIISDKSSNFSNNTISNKHLINFNKINNNQKNNIINDINGNNINLTDRNNYIEKKVTTTSIKNGNILKKYNSNYSSLISSPGINYSVSRSSNIENKISSIKSNNSNNNNTNGINNIIHFNTNTNTNNTNTNGNISIGSLSKKKEDGYISEINPLDMVNQMASSNNSNIFSELQIKEGEGEYSDIKNKKTEEEFYNDDNIKLTFKDEYSNMKDNISGNFSINNNYNEKCDENINDNENEENKENLNFINSLDDSLEYSKTKSYIVNDTPVVVGKGKDNNNSSSNYNSSKNRNKYYTDNSKINNKDESVNIYNSNSNNINTDINIIRNINNKNIERYKNSTSNKSKNIYDNDSEQNFSSDIHSNASNISSILQNNNNKQNIQHHRQLSYHNNKQSSSNKHKTNNNTINTNTNININISNYNNSINKENLDPNNNNDINETNSNEKMIYKNKTNKTYNDIKNKDEDLKISNNNNNNFYHKSLIHKDININSFPLNTVVIQKKIYKNNSKIPDIIKEQKTKDSFIEQFKTNDEKILFINENSNNNSNINYNEGYSNTYILDKSTQNQYNTYYSDNNSFKNNDKDRDKDINSYSNIFRKALKKKYLIKEFSQNRNSKFNIDTDNHNEVLHPQRISNDLITKLRDWLISCDLLCYYNLLIKNNIYDIESYIINLKNNKINISYKDIEDLGIKKPGHIFRFLLKLQMDIGILDNKVCDYITSKFNENVLTTLGVNVSINEIKYCGMLLCPGTNDYSRNCNYTDIFSFLKSKNLMEFKENFIHNGFDQIEFILIQLFSSFAFNKDILNDYMHIYSERDKNKVIKKLYEEKKNISREIGINYDEREVLYILNENNEEMENSDKKNGEKSFCNIF